MAVFTTINDPSEFFHTQLYTGNGSDTQAITNDAASGDFQPDLLWIKRRSGVENNMLADAVRTATKRLISNSNGVEDSYGVNSFNTDGFTTLTGAVWNASSATYVAWQWKANGSGSSNETGTINTTATSANTTAGFSICKWTGNATASQTIGHGLSAAPDLIIVKNTADADAWEVFHSALGNTQALELNNANAKFTATNQWDNTSPTSTVFTVDTDTTVNGSSDAMIAYCWAGVQGYSKFGQYTGSNNVDGPYIHLGFKPAFLLIKEYNNSEAWILWDNKRDPYNEVQKTLVPNGTDAESTDATNDDIDFLATGFKVRCTSYINNSGGEYLYMAWAESPLVNSKSVPCTAR